MRPVRSCMRSTMLQYRFLALASLHIELDMEDRYQTINWRVCSHQPGAFNTTLHAWIDYFRVVLSMTCLPLYVWLSWMHHLRRKRWIQNLSSITKTAAKRKNSYSAMEVIVFTDAEETQAKIKVSLTAISRIPLVDIIHGKRWMWPKQYRYESTKEYFD